MKLSPNVEELLEKRYYIKDENNLPIEDWEKLSTRVVDWVYEEDKRFYRDQAFNAFYNREFLPNSPCIVAAGMKGRRGAFFACYTFDIEDSMNSIMETCKNIAFATQKGGGTGFNLSKIRPEGDYVSSNHKNALGPCKVMELYSKTGEVLTQNGFREAAIMAMLDVRHPDIIKFINYKKDKRILTNVNISVIVDHDFMSRALKGQNYNLVFNNKIRETLNASDVLRQMATVAHICGDPGIVYREEMFDNTPHIEPLVSTNPCGEFIGEDKGICCLGSINLVKCLNDDSSFNYDKLQELTRIGVRFLDNIIDTSVYPTIDNEIMMKKYRAIGLGVMGYADILVKNKLVYGSNEALKFTEEIFSKFQLFAHEASIELAKEKGIPELLQENGFDRRNLRVTVQAPTGSLARIAECSFGIEPIFGLGYKNKLSEYEYSFVYPLLIEYCEENKLSITDALNHNESLPAYFVTSHEIPYSRHIKTMSVIQKYFDNAISKTINMNEDCSIDEIEDSFKMGWKLNCKGMTVYRDNSLESQTIVFDELDNDADNNVELSRGEIKKKPNIIHGLSTKFYSSCGKVNVHLNYDEQGNPFDVFVSTKGGGCDANIHGLAILTSLCLRAGVPLEEINKRMSSVKCSACITAKARNSEDKKVDVISCPAGIVSNSVKLFNIIADKDINSRNELTDNLKEEIPSKYKAKCPKCGEFFDNRKVKRYEGCIIIPCPNKCNMCN